MLKPLNWQQWVNFTPCALGAGALLYFALPDEPSVFLGLLGLPLLALIWINRANTVLFQTLLYMFLALTGLWLTMWISQHQQTVFLPNRVFYAPITGIVDDVIEADGKVKLMLHGVTSPKLADTRPLRLRLTARLNGQTLRNGDRINTTATIFPPSRPALPDGYDFTRHFFYQYIEAVGYTTGPVTIEQRAPPPRFYAFHTIMQSARAQVATYFLNTLPQPAAGIAVALVTGQKDAITRQASDALRDASLSHMLAISGMHMGIICGVTFLIIRFLLACIPAIALNHPIKHYAAVFALVCGALYLALANFPISAVRAYVMVAIVFGAVLLNREADTLRCIVLAALLILCINPANSISISFQLSFCATLGLVLVYRRMRTFSQKLHLKTQHWWLRLPVIILQIGFTSLIAGLVTIPLVAYHFNHIAVYGIVANMLALPLLSFVVAPSLLAAGLLMPFGAQIWALDITVAALNAIVAIAQHITTYPLATLHIPPLSAMAVILITLALFVLITARCWQHAIGAVAIIVFSALWLSPQHEADILIAEDGSAIAVMQHDKWQLLKGTSCNFHVQQWMQTTGAVFTTYDDNWQCDNAGCDGIVKDKAVRVRFDYKDDKPLCLADTDIMISIFYSDRWHCDGKDAVRIDRSLLERNGGYALTVKNDQITQWHSCIQQPGRRWKRCGS